MNSSSSWGEGLLDPSSFSLSSEEEKPPSKRRKESGAEPVTLASAAEKTVAESLGKLAESFSCRFTCGGELTSPDKIQLVYENSTGELNKVVFPGASDVDIQQLLDACSVASFGRNDQLVTDTNYRNSLKLDPDHFVTSFQVATTSIQLAAMTMMPNVQGIQAELYKLNIYTSGGFFKTHVDTPKSEQMFGSLVVCLPTQFSGGELVIRHHGHTVKFDWSSPPENPRKTASWAVFFSDVEHEVLPVTEGHRITLTYNLYAKTCETKAIEAIPLHDTSINPLYKELSAALCHPYFMRGGGVLGFVCQHKYACRDLNSTSSLPRLLKGADEIVYSVAKSLGLSVIVKPVIKDYRYYPSLIEDPTHYVLLEHHLDFRTGTSYYDEEDPCEVFTDLFSKGHHIHHITWCHNISEKFNDSQQEVAGCIGTHGNEPNIEVLYKIVAILVAVPEWGESRKSCGLSNPQDPQSTSGTMYSEAIFEKFCFHGKMPDYAFDRY